MAYINVEDLVLDFSKYDDDGKPMEPNRALDGVSFSVEKGSFVAVVGMNGSGKSTLAKCLNGLLLPTSGSVEINGMKTSDESHIWDIRSNIGMVFQNPDNQLVSSIVEDDVAFGPENLGVDPEEIRKRVDEALKRVDMYDCKDKAAHMLSGGQKQRIAIAGAVAMRPSCIVFDEPTAMLDPAGRAKVMGIIKDLNKEGITVVLITHFMEEAMEADRIIVMQNGRIIGDRTPAELFADTEFVHEAGRREHIMSIEVKDLKYIYSPDMPGETTALDGVSFDVTEPSVIGIIGQTGSGKSTLLQHLNGLIKPTSGEIYIDGECITGEKKNLTDVRRKIGLVFQYPEYQLFEETVAKDVAFGPKNLGADEEDIDRRVRHALELVGLDYDEVAEMSPFELSGGMKRRAAIAGVLAMEPSILMLDEPMAGLDPQAHRDMLGLIKRVQQEMNSIILFVSHNMGDVAELSDRLLVMNKGRIVMDDGPHEIFKRRDELSDMGLSVPPIAEIAQKISDKHKDFESNPLTIGELADDIKEYRKTNR